MLTVIAILAASLSSPYLGTFFDIPGWMQPESVASDRTYGSPDATNATHRIDTTALRAVNAIFEGWAERCYYTHSGPSNDWDVATYGPLGESRFRFAVPQNPDDYYYDVWHPWFVWRPDTNRVANAGTRRFVEYEHLQALAGTLAWPGPGVELEMAARIVRPNWRQNTEYTYGGIRFSSTLFDAYAQNPLPTFGWSAPGEALTPRDWGEAALDWHFAADPENADDEFSWKLVDGSGAAGVIAYEMLSDLHWGEAPSVAAYCPPVWTNVEDTTEQIVSKPYDVPIIHREPRETQINFTADEVLFGPPEPQIIGGSLDTAVRAAMGELFPTGGFSGRLSGAVQMERFMDIPVNPDVTVSMTFGRMMLVDSDGNEYQAGPFPLGVGKTLRDVLPEGEDQYTITTNNATEPWPLNLEFLVDVAELPDSLIVSYPWPTGKPDLTTFNVAMLDVGWPVSNNVCKVHGVGTNDTRRLVTDQVAGLGQCLSAIDRTFARMDASVDEGIEASYYRVIDYESDPQDVTPVYFENGIGYVDDEIMFSGFHVVGGHTNHSTSAVGNRRHIYAGCSRTTTYVGGGPVGQSTGQWFDVGSYDSIRNAVNPGGEELEYDRYVHLSFVEDDLHPDGFHYYGYAVDQSGHAGRTTAATYVPASSNIPNVVCYASYSRSYSYGRTRLDSLDFRGGEDERQILYPGSADRVREATLWHLGSRLREAGSASSTVLMSAHYVAEIPRPEDLITWSVQHRAGKIAYTGPGDLFGLCRDMFFELLTDCDNWVSSSVGVGDYRIPAQVVPMSPGDVSFEGKIGFCRIAGKVPVCEVTLSPFSANVRLPKDGGPGEGKIFVIKPDGTEVETDPHDLGAWIYLSTVEGGWGENVPPEERRSSQPDRYGARENVKVRGLSRVDWEWGALRRGE